jgi:hypothetical protein
MRIKDMVEIEDTTKEQIVTGNTKLKELLVDYTGKKESPKDDSVTVEMIINTLVDDFPELMLVIAEENYLRGYEQALDDVNNLREKYGQNTKLYPKNSRQQA